MSTGFNALNDVSVTGLVNIEADSVASGIIIASEIIVDGVNITDLLDDLENEIDTNATNIAQLQTDVAYLQNNVGYKNANNTWTGQNIFDSYLRGNSNVECYGPIFTTSSATQTTINGTLVVNSDNVTFDCGNICQFVTNPPKCSLTAVATDDLTNKFYVDSVIGASSILALNNTWTGTNSFTKPINVTTNFGSSANIPLYVQDSIGNQSFNVLPNSGPGSYNPNNGVGECVIFSKPSAVNNGVINVTTWSQTNTGLKIMPTSVRLGAGGLQQPTPTSYILCDGTGVIANAPTFIFTTTSLPTCTAAIPSSSDSSTKIPTTQWIQGAIAAKIPFAPRFYNYRVEMPYNVAHTQGLRIDFNGTWTEKDFFIISVRAQNNYAGSSSWPPLGLNEWQDYATAAGEIIFRPYYTPIGTWGITTPYNYWPTNNGTIFGNVQKFMYTTNATLNGTNLFIAAGNGTTGGLNATGFVNLRGTNYGGFGNSWVYTCSVEYISISQDTPGSGHVFFTATPQYGGINQYLS